MENNRHGEAVAPAQPGARYTKRRPSPISSGAAAEAATPSHGLWLLGLALLTFAVRAPGIFYGFVYDDIPCIENRSRAAWSHIPAFFTSNQSAFFGSNFYRPVLNTWYEACYALFGVNAAAWHVTSILLHVACTLLVFRLALAVVESFPVAWVAAALFGVHPAHVEAVSWASAMGDPLMTLFLLLAVLAFLRWMEQGRPLWLAASFVAGAACVFSKETGVVMPVVLLATVLALRSRAKPGLPVLAATLPFFAITAVFLGLRQSILGAFSHPMVSISGPRMIYTWPAVLLFYLRHMIWPTVVSPFYPLAIVQDWNSREFFIPLAVLTAASALLGYLLWRSAGWRRSAVCLVWILAPLAPALYLKAMAPFELVHDRFLYAPLVGFCMAAALIFQWMSERIEAKLHWRIFPLLALTLIPVLGIETMSQMVWWQNNATLFTRSLTVTPDNPKALIGLASADISQRRYQQAWPLLQRALQISPRDSTALFAEGRIAWEMGDDAAAEKYLTQALSIYPRYDIWVHLVSVELHRNRLDAAQAAAQQAIAMNSAGVGAHIAMGSVLLAKGDRAGAIREFQQELRYHPQSVAAQEGIARASGNPPPAPASAVPAPR